MPNFLFFLFKGKTMSGKWRSWPDVRFGSGRLAVSGGSVENYGDSLAQNYAQIFVALF